MTIYDLMKMILASGSKSFKEQIVEKIAELDNEMNSLIKVIMELGGRFPKIEDGLIKEYICLPEYLSEYFKKVFMEELDTGLIIRFEKEHLRKSAEFILENIIKIKEEKQHLVDVLEVKETLL